MIRQDREGISTHASNHALIDGQARNAVLENKVMRGLRYAFAAGV